MIEVTFVPDGATARTVSGKTGDTLMRIATRNSIRGIDGECGGSCACGTCHVIVADDWFEKVGPPGIVENTLLEMAETREDNSRLSCQIKISQDLDGLIVRIPKPD